MPTPPHKTLQELQCYPMEQLKSLHGLMDADPRFAEVILFGDDDEVPKSYTLEDHYRRFTLIQPPARAPEEVFGSFVTAQHLAIYGWFCYPMTAVSENQAYASLELALRRRMNAAQARGLKARIEHACREGWLRPEKLLRLDPCLSPESQRNFRNRAIDPNGKAALQFMIENLPKERNWLAHGNFSPGTDPFMTLDTVAQLLEQLYPDQ